MLLAELEDDDLCSISVLLRFPLCCASCTLKVNIRVLPLPYSYVPVLPLTGIPCGQEFIVECFHFTESQGFKTEC